MASHIDLIRFHLLQAAIQSHKSLVQLKLQSCQATLLLYEAEVIHVWHYMQMYSLATSNIKSDRQDSLSNVLSRHTQCNTFTFSITDHPSRTACLFYHHPLCYQFWTSQECNCLYYKIKRLWYYIVEFFLWYECQCLPKSTEVLPWYSYSIRCQYYGTLICIYNSIYILLLWYFKEHQI